jgi:acyl-CoA hydrolase
MAMASGTAQSTSRAEAAAALVKSGDWVDYGFGMGQPDLFDRALAARKAELRGVKIRVCLTHARARPRGRPARRALPLFNWHFSATTAASTTPDAATTSP